MYSLIPNLSKQALTQNEYEIIYRDQNNNTFSGEHEEDYLGEIFICEEKVYEQAISYDHSNEREFAFLLTHGLLHLLGYDHIEKEDEVVMFKKQDELLNKTIYRRN